MPYFTIKQSFWLVSSNKCDEEFKEIDKFMEFLENSEVGEITKSLKEKEANNKKSQFNFPTAPFFIV